MKKLIYIAPIAILALAGCSKAASIFDSEIYAIDRQSEVLKEQNRILERIATALEKIENEKGETK